MKPVTLFVPLTLLTLSASIEAGVRPEGWLLAGSEPQAYSIAVDDQVGYQGKSSGRLASHRPTSGFGTMMQTIDPAGYVGRRVRYSGWVKAADVKRWAGLWMRVDGAERKTLAFDNMRDRAITATTDWTRYDVVLDVSREAVSISFGILLNGEGTVWIDDIDFAVVEASVPVTGTSAQRQHPAGPAG